MSVAQRIELAPRPASAAEARSFVARALGDLSVDCRELGVLLASELVTNAVLYSEGQVVLVVGLAGNTVRVTVRDESDQAVTPRQVGPDATSGRGLALVEKLSSAWGMERLPQGGKEVWFEMPRA